MRIGPIISALVLIAASGANATTYELGLKGTLVAQTSAGADPHWNVGDVVTVRARFDDSHVMSFEGADAQFAGLYGLPVSGEQFFSMSGDGGVWTSRDEQNDGASVLTDTYYEVHANSSETSYSRAFGNPVISFRNGKVSAFSGYMVPIASEVPVLSLGSSVSGSRRCANAVPGGPVSCEAKVQESPSECVRNPGKNFSLQ